MSLSAALPLCLKLAVTVDADQFGIRKALPCNLRHKECEAICVVKRIVCGSAIVVAKYLFGRITVKVERLNGNIGSA